MWCSDSFVNYLKDFGYSIVRLPRRDIYPLEVYSERGGSLDYVGKLTTIFQAGNTISLPKINRDVPAANISGRRTSSLDIGIGLTLLGSILGAMGGSQIGLDTQYQHARSIMFEFHEVLQDTVEPAKLEQYLANARINPFSRHVNQLLDANKIYVTTATLKSKKLTVEAKVDNKVPLELHVPTLQGNIGGNIKVSGKADNTSKISSKGMKIWCLASRRYNFFM